MEKTNVMVCVTKQKTCERLIHNGSDYIEKEGDTLYVVHVVNTDESFLNKQNDGEALEYLFEVSKKAGADLTVLRSNDIPRAMIDFALDNNITHVIMGKSPDENEDNYNLPRRLQKELGDIDFKLL